MTKPEPDLDAVVEEMAAALDNLSLLITARKLQHRPVARLIQRMRTAIHEYRSDEAGITDRSKRHRPQD